METKQLKKRFFALYWGQRYQINNKGVFKINEKAFPLSDSEEKILLRHLKDIEKDDLIFICTNTEREITEIKLLNIFENKSVTYLEVKIFFQNGWTEFDFPVEKAKTIDYLRSKGYALPFMEYSVDDLISFGWVKII